MANESRDMFLDAASAWLCDGYSADVRFIAGINGGKYQLWDALILLNPLPTPDGSFAIESDGFLVGQVQWPSLEKAALLAGFGRAYVRFIDTDDAHGVARLTRFERLPNSRKLDAAAKGWPVARFSVEALYTWWRDAIAALLADLLNVCVRAGRQRVQ